MIMHGNQLHVISDVYESILQRAQEVKIEDRKVDPSQYETQIGCLGKDSMVKLWGMHVLVVGAKGLGVEIAKHFVLAGCEAVMMYDDDIVQPSDVGANFCLRESDVGSKRGVAVTPRLSVLNSDVHVKSHTGIGLNLTLISGFQIVIFTETSRDQLLYWSEVCHLRNIAFIAAEARGAAGYVFVDFGEKYTVEDEEGEESHPFFVKNVGRGPDGRVNTVIQLIEGMRHDFGPGDELVLFSGANTTAADIATKKAYKIVETTNNRIMLDIDIQAGESPDKECWPPPAEGLLAQKVKKSTTLKFRTMRECITRPRLATNVHPSDPQYQVEARRANSLHLAFQGLYSFMEEYEIVPELRDDDHAEEMLRLVQDFDRMSRSIDTRIHAQADPVLTTGSLDGGGGRRNPGGDDTRDLTLAEVVSNVAHFASVELLPVVSFFGGVVAQEAIKFATKKFVPVMQYYYTDMFALLPEPSMRADLALCYPHEPYSDGPGGFGMGAEEGGEEEGGGDGGGSGASGLELGRHDHLRAVFGPEVVEEMRQMTVLVHGASDVGGEIVKNLAVMGICCAPAHGGGSGGRCVIADGTKLQHGDDRQMCISSDSRAPDAHGKSTGKRRRADVIGRNAAEVVAEAAEGVNAKFGSAAEVVRAQCSADGSVSSCPFGDHFWSKIDCVFSAGGSFHSRRAVDQYCVKTETPLIDVGAERWRAHAQVVLPFVTECYRDLTDSTEGDTPLEINGHTSHVTAWNNQGPRVMHFPTTLEHCVDWAAWHFHLCFIESPTSAAKFCYNSQSWLKAMKTGKEDADALRVQGEEDKANRRVAELLVRTRGAARAMELVQKDGGGSADVGGGGASWENCVILARKSFEELFQLAPLQLLEYTGHAPAGKGKTKPKKGKPAAVKMVKLWNSSSHRKPLPLDFDPADRYHLSFVRSAALLYAQVLGIQVPGGASASSSEHDKDDASLSDEALGSIASAAQQFASFAEDESIRPAPGMRLKLGLKTTDPSIPDDPEIEYAYPACDNEVDDRITCLEELSAKLDLASFCIGPVKDPLGKLRNDFIAAAAALRARCYGLREASEGADSGGAVPKAKDRVANGTSSSTTNLGATLIGMDGSASGAVVKRNDRRGNNRRPNFPDSVFSSQCRTLRRRRTPTLSPAVSCAAALAMVELIKFVQEKALEEHRNSFVDLSRPCTGILHSTPAPARGVFSSAPGTIDPASGKPLLAIPEGHTCWDKEEVATKHGGVTLEAFLRHLDHKYKCKVLSVAIAGPAPGGGGGGQKLVLYENHVKRHKARLTMSLEDLYTQVGHMHLPANRRSIMLRVESESHLGRVALPIVNYCFHDEELIRHAGATAARRAAAVAVAAGSAALALL
jgi:molybdopterin/thiamine biosynthesis adenylyltransferase